MDILLTLTFIFIGVLFLAILVILLIGMICYKFTFKRYDDIKEPMDYINRVNDPEVIDWLNKVDREEIDIKAFDNIKLHGFYLKSLQNLHKTIIFVHGYRSIYCKAVAVAKYFYEKGYNILFYCQRGHHYSEGTTTMGYKEEKDLKSWINYLVNLDNSMEIGLLGFSMGAHVAMLAVGDDIPTNVKYAIEDAGYSNLYQEFEEMLKKKSKFAPTKFLLYCTKNISDLHGFPLNSDVTKSLRNSKVPTLFIHGTKDVVVDYKHFESCYKNFNSNIYKEAKTFPNSDHCCSFINYSEEYLGTVENFIKKVN